MSRIHEELPNQDFERPEEIVELQVCSESGKLPIPGVCDMDPRGSCIITEYFEKGMEPIEMCDVHIIARVCGASQLLSSEMCWWDEHQVRVILPVLQEGAPDDPTADTAFGVSVLPQYSCTLCTGGVPVQSITVTENYDRLMSVTAARKQ